MTPRARLAPSPTGAMHLGNARTALLAWLQARQAGGVVVMRIEDLDAARVVPGAEQRLLEETRWLGLDWDEGPEKGGPHAPYRQGERAALYEEAAARLVAGGLAYECACSRAEIAAASSAPHGEGDGPRYPGTCRALPPGEAAERARSLGRRTALRFRGEGARIPFRDLVQGEVDPLGEAGLDDFVIRRSDGVAAYQLAVVVDDAAMAITHVLRADDLLSSTPRQIALYGALGKPVPSFAHVPLVLAPGGERLAKRNRPQSVGDLRAAGLSEARIVGALAASAGLAEPGREVMPPDLLGRFDPTRLPRDPVVLALDPART